MTIDALLWLGFCWIAITTSLRFTALSADNFQLVDGVDDVMKWWFYITVPIAFTLMSGRVIGNWLEDLGNYRSGDTNHQTSSHRRGCIMSDGSWITLISLGVTALFHARHPGTCWSSFTG